MMEKLSSYCDSLRSEWPENSSSEDIARGRRAYVERPLVVLLLLGLGDGWDAVVCGLVDES
jgi:hypothetical protein